MFNKTRDKSISISSLSFMEPHYHWAAPFSYALLRFAFGLTMISHGIPKLLGIAHGSMANPMAASTGLIANVLHLPFAPQLALCVAILEFFGGLALAVGLSTRLIALMLLIQMVVICIALGPTFPWIDRGIEYPLMLGFTALLFFTHGGGSISVDRLIEGDWFRAKKAL